MWLNIKNLSKYGELFLECDQSQHNFQEYAKEYFVLNFFRCNFARVYQKKATGNILLERRILNQNIIKISDFGGFQSLKVRKTITRLIYVIFIG
jgi:hypothetical protein